MQKERKKISIPKLFDIFFIITISVFILLVIDVGTLVISIIFLKNNILETALMVIAITLAILLIIVGIFFVQKGKTLLYDVLYVGARDNIKVFTHRKKVFEPIKNDRLIEADELNDLFDKVTKHFSSLCIEDGSLATSEIKLEFQKGSRTLVTYDSLVENIPNILKASNYFRHAFIQLRYSLGNDIIKDKDVDSVIKNIRKALNYNGLLIAESSDQQGFLIFAPRIDSISQLKEEIEQMVKGSSLLKRNPQGSEIAPCRVSVVVYPYSSSESIMDDLKFASRLNKNINIYIPNPQLGTNPNWLLDNANTGQVSKFIESLSSLKVDSLHLDSSYRQVTKLISQVSDYFSFSCAGIIEFDNDSDSFMSKYSYSAKNSHIFPQGVVVNSEFVESINQSKDIDNSYYFTSRKHLNNRIAPFIDIFCIESGLFYVITNNEKAIAILYFLNDDKELNLNNYSRESLMVFSYILSSFFRSIRDTNFSVLNRTRFRDIIRLSDIKLYSVAKKSHRLTFLSDSLMDEISTAKKHNMCYKALYNRSAPCENCPLKTKHSMIQMLGQNKYQTTVVLHNEEDDSAHLLVQPVGAQQTMDRFDKNTLTNSYFSYIDNLTNALLGGVKGYVLYLSITNLTSLIEKDGNEGYSFLLRNFTRQLRDTTGQMSLFLYRDNVLCFILPDFNRHHIIELCEKIYALSKMCKSLNGSQYPLDITYIASHFSQEYNTVASFNNAMEKIFPVYTKDSEPDLLHFPETNHTRRASKTGYLLSVIDEAFSNKSFQIKLQPVVNNINWRMVGAELLLRLRDEYRDLTLNTNEIIKVAGQHNRISMMSDAILSYMGDLYNRHGYSFFKAMGLLRLSLNTDYSYFENSGFIEKLGTLSTKHSIPKDFITLEISEKDVADHLEGYSKITSGIIKTNTDLICDRYTGDHVSLQMLKDLGFTEIKISQSLVLNIGEDASYLNKVENIYRNAKLIGLRVTLVGIENKTNYDLIKDECRESSIQGKYFYEPLDETAFLEALRKSNV